MGFRLQRMFQYEKDGFAFLIDGFELSKPFSSREKGFPPRLMTVAIRRGGKCGGGMKQSQELSNFKSSDEDYFDSIFGFDKMRTGRKPSCSLPTTGERSAYGV